jgi:hypothetical protein
MAQGAIEAVTGCPCASPLSLLYIGYIHRYAMFAGMPCYAHAHAHARYISCRSGPYSTYSTPYTLLIDLVLVIT